MQEKMDKPKPLVICQLASFYIAGILAGMCIAKVEYNFTFIFFTVLFLIITIFEYHYYFKEQKFWQAKK